MNYFYMLYSRFLFGELHINKIGQQMIIGCYILITYFTIKPPQSKISFILKLSIVVI